MKKSICCIFILVQTLNFYAQPGSEKTEESIFNCIARIRHGMTHSLPQGESHNFQLYADTIYRYLYIDSIKVKTSVELLAKITLQSLFLETKDKRTDYEDIKRSLMITHKFDAFYDPFFVSCAQGLGMHYETQEKYDEAATAYQLARKALSKVFNNKPNYMEVQLNRNLARIYFVHLKQYPKALEYQKSTVKSIEQTEGSTSGSYFYEINNLATQYSIAGMSQLSDSCLAIYQHHIESNPQVTRQEKLNFYENRASAADGIGKTKDAIGYYEKAIEYAYNDSIKIQEYINIGILQARKKDYTNLTNTIDRILSIIEPLEQSNPKLLFQTAQLCNIPNANKQRERVIRLYEFSKDKKNVAHLAQRAYIHWISGHYDTANKIIKHAMLLADESIKQDSAFLQGNDIMDLVTTLTKMMDMRNTIRYESMVLEDCSKLYGESHPIVLSIMLHLAGCQLINGNYQEAENIANTALRILAEEAPERAEFADIKAESAFWKGQFMQAVQYYNQALQAQSDAHRLFNTYFKISSCLISEYDLRKSNKDNRLPLYQIDSLLYNTTNELSILRKKHFSPTSLEAFYVLNTQASHAWLRGDLVQMRDYTLQAEDIAIEHIENPELKQDCLESLAFYYILAKDYKKALSMIGNSTPQLAITNYISNQLLAEASLGLGHKKKAQSYYLHEIEDVIENIRKNFVYMTEKERSHYWNIFKQSIYDAGKYAEVYDKPSEFAGTLYNMALFSKGLLLRSSVQLYKDLENNGDSVVLDRLNTIRQLRMNIADGKGKGETRLYEIEAERLEKELMLKSEKINDFTQSATCDWKAIKAHLTDDDLAIEFITYYTPDSIGHYAALLLRKKYKQPILVDIAEKDVLENQLGDLAINKKNSNYIWQPLATYLEGIQNIYFSPTGLLHKLGIEYLPFEDAEFISDKYSIYRLSSTMELARGKKASHLKPINTAALYGGMEFDIDSQTLIDATNISNNKNVERDFKMRLTYLEGTLSEVDTISALLSKAGTDTHLFTEIEGTEHSFKWLSGKGYELIHIATHGFCTIDKTSSGDMTSLARFQSVKTGIDQMMYRSGLFFSGANIALQNTELPDGVDDGILTAQEISLLNLQHADLVVLSACVTGGGDITGEGVFGVQRGFKLAGVNSIIMSSWNVSDKATLLLMSNFYRNLLNGQNKRNALLQAIKKVKKQEEYKDYHFWAPFIIIDALD